MDESHIYELLRDLRAGQLDHQKSLGRLEEGQKNLSFNIEVASSNISHVSDSLEKHKDDIGAHGLKIIRMVMGWGTAGVALAGAVLTLYHKMKGGQ